MKKLIPAILIFLLVVGAATYTYADTIAAKNELVGKKVLLVYQTGEFSSSIKCIVLDIIPVHYSILLKVDYNGSVEYFPLSNISFIKEE
jgi:hypothetical protein